MDFLNGLSREALHIIPWVVAACLVSISFLWRRLRLHWTLFGATLLFAALNALTALYVLQHFHDPRWSTGGQTPLTAPSLAGTPMVGQFLGPLDSAMNGVVGGVNDFLAFKNALPAALDFLEVSGWALLLSVPVAIIATGISWGAARRRAAQARRDRIAVDELRADVDRIKLQLASARITPGPAADFESPRPLPRDSTEA